MKNVRYIGRSDIRRVHNYTWDGPGDVQPVSDDNADHLVQFPDFEFVDLEGSDDEMTGTDEEEYDDSDENLDE